MAFRHEQCPEIQKAAEGIMSCREPMSSFNTSTTPLDSKARAYRRTVSEGAARYNLGRSRRQDRISKAVLLSTAFPKYDDIFRDRVTRWRPVLNVARRLGGTGILPVIHGQAGCLSQPSLQGNSVRGRSPYTARIRYRTYAIAYSVMVHVLGVLFEIVYPVVPSLIPVG